MLTPGTGVVAEFDEPRGLGVIRGDDGADVPFHCTAIADGSRTVETGRRVRFEVVPGLLGRWEASGIEKL
ncbi:MAG TPA: cold shock domain-containing protein [Acidimicrobiales bacterium]|jgi:cold shock CspA family protein|nr:cold shock domain-containing protein [Acidimicrobiales bacterium]